MSQRREIEAQLALYDDLSGILGAMRSFALAELHRISRREEAQQEVVRVLAQALQDVAPFQPPPEPALVDVWLLLGSVRGFCGSFNEDVVRAWRAKGGQRQPLIVVGERLAATMPEQASLFPVAGADGGLDAAAAIECLDLVISCDTSIAHLAGALGRPVWTALRAAPEWRWQRETPTSVWYPSMRLFRQSSPTYWHDAFGAMEGELRQLAIPA